ncbi:metal ABC transporter permease [Frigidibacter oleivorans]|uniref:metal ABC transporter permease n=1 Tax=Frigidibacter oleivorans TaxID=2487129 RepID=UPI002E26D8B6
MMDMLLFPFQLDFMRNAFLVMLLIAPAAGMLSALLVLKGWSLMGDAVSHAVLPGIVLAYVAGLPLILGAFGAGLFCAVAAGHLRETSRIKADTAMGVVFAGMFGLGIVLYTAIESDLHLDHILFGNMLGVGAGDLWTAGLIAGGVALALLVAWRALMAQAFDPVQAHALGLPVRLLHYGLLAALSATIVAMLSSVGLVLSIAILIAPGATAFLLVRRFAAMMAVAVLLTAGAGVAGVYASFWIDSAPAPTIVLILTGLFLLALVRHGWRARAQAAA